MSYWYLAINGKTEGPITLEEIAQRIRSQQVTPQTFAYAQGMSDWAPLGQIQQFQQFFQAGSIAPPPPPIAGTSWKRCHEIDYEILGSEMQFVEIALDPGESMVAEAGSMFYMTQGIVMETQFSDGSQPNAGLFDKLLSAGKRVLTGESLFLTFFTCRSGGREKVAFAAPYPGKIIPLNLSQIGGTIICQKDAFLCAAKGTSVGIAFTRKIGAGLFGGEGFILQKLEGDGWVFVHSGGTIVEKELAAGETLKVDTGCLVAFQPTVNYDIQFVGGFKNTLFGGEGLFFATLTGPGKIFLQSLPFSRMADRIYAAAPKAGGGRREEGSILGGLGGLLDGDNN
jgi:uncharacterized protein (TIGR00266 family)